MNPETRHIPINAFMCRDVKTVAGFGFNNGEAAWCDTLGKIALSNKATTVARNRELAVGKQSHNHACRHERLEWSRLESGPRHPIPTHDATKSARGIPCDGAWNM